MNTPNYNESTIAGTKHERTCRILIDHPFQAPTTVMTVEEIVKIEDDGDITHKDNGNLFLVFDPENADDLFVYNYINAKVVAARQARDNQTN